MAPPSKTCKEGDEPDWNNWTLVTLTLSDDDHPDNPADHPTWYFTLMGMAKQAKVQLKIGDAWEFLADWTSISADKARRDRLAKPDHAHNLFPYPMIVVTKTDNSQVVPKLGLLTPTKREHAMHQANKQWEQENSTRRLQRSHYNGVTLGDRAPVILNASDDPDEQSITQSKEGSHHQLQYRDIQMETGRKLQNSQSFTNKSKSSGTSKRTRISLASIASAVSSSSMEAPT